LEKRSNVSAFVEIKKESLDMFGVPRVISAVIQGIAPVQDRCVIISYDIPVLRSARANGITKIGLVLTTYDELSRSATEALGPEFVICNYQKLPPPPAALWTGRWQWALYEFDDPELALTWSKRGVDFIETMAVGDLLKHPGFRQGADVADESV
jgi:glycerophosphoryl diester phosphodiesterase